MRTTFLSAWPAVALLARLSTPGSYPAQQPGWGKPQTRKPPPDEFRSLVREVEEAYKAPFEVDKDILDELRKQYKNPTPEREAKIFLEIRRPYHLTPTRSRTSSANSVGRTTSRHPGRRSRSSGRSAATAACRMAR